MNRPTQPRRSKPESERLAFFADCSNCGRCPIDPASATITFTGGGHRVVEYVHAPCGVTAYGSLHITNADQVAMERFLLENGASVLLVDEEMDDAARANTAPLHQIILDFTRCLAYVDQLAGTAVRETEERA